MIEFLTYEQNTHKNAKMKKNSLSGSKKFVVVKFS
jgi:hypothetical protein